MARKPKKEDEQEKASAEAAPEDPAALDQRYKRITAYSTLAIAALIAIYMIVSATVWMFSSPQTVANNNDQSDLIAQATRDQNVLLLRMTGMLDDIRKNTQN